jgi:hypothetical protein
VNSASRMRGSFFKAGLRGTRIGLQPCLFKSIGSHLPPSPDICLTGDKPVPPTLSRSTTLLVWGAIIVADLSSLLFFASHHLSNLYGDGMAHVEGARRIFDSLTPGYREIGTVWLPLFHLLAAPLAINNTLWRTGLAGSLVSATAFAVAAWVLFRLGFEMNRNVAAGVLAVAGFLLCVSLLYLASAPMTEVPTILWAVLVVFSLFRFQQSGRTASLVGASIAALLGTLTRYDGWYLLPFATLFVFLGRRESWTKRFQHAIVFGSIAALGPLLWIAHNAYRFHNPFEFYDGPGSARAIYIHQLITTGFAYPTDRSLWVSGHYYLEDLRLVLGPWSLILASLGAIVWIAEREQRRRRAAALLLLVPLPFYVQSLAFSSVALYVPTLFPHSYYNLRYGLEMAPALALLPSFLLSGRLSRGRCAALVALLIAVLGGQCLGAVWRGARKIPVVTEAIVNTPCRSPVQQDVIRFLRSRYAGGEVLLDSNEWPCVMPEVGIPYREIVTPRDKRFMPDLRSRAGASIRWVVFKRGDAVDHALEESPNAFKAFARVDVVHPTASSCVGILLRRRP